MQYKDGVGGSPGVWRMMGETADLPYALRPQRAPRNYKEKTNPVFYKFFLLPSRAASE